MIFFQFYLTKLKDELNDPNNEYIQSVARRLQMMLRIDQYRIEFVALDGVSSIIKVLRGKVNFQIQYQLSFCLWVLTFNITIAEKLNAYGVIPVLADILADAQKEKVSRIILAVFRVSTYFFITRKYPLRGYILGVLLHTTAWDRIWRGYGTLTMWF